jgi:hypothetical protein
MVVLRIHDSDRQDLEDYERHIVQHFRYPGRRENARRGVHTLWRYSRELSDPFGSTLDMSKALGAWEPDRARTRQIAFPSPSWRPWSHKMAS